MDGADAGVWGCDFGNGGLAWETFKDTTVMRLRYEDVIYVLKNYDFILFSLSFLSTIKKEA